MAMCPFLSSTEKKVNCSLNCALYIAKNDIDNTASCAFKSIAKNLETLDKLANNTNKQLYNINNSMP